MKILLRNFETRISNQNPILALVSSKRQERGVNKFSPKKLQELPTPLSETKSTANKNRRRLRLCRSLLLLIYEVVYCSFKECKSWHFFYKYAFCFYRKPRACCPRLWSTIVRVPDWTNDLFHSRSRLWLVGCVFRTNLTRDFFVCKSQFVWNKSEYVHEENVSKIFKLKEY